MREKFFEKVHLGSHFKSTSTQSPNEFRESTHISVDVKSTINLHSILRHQTIFELEEKEL